MGGTPGGDKPPGAKGEGAARATAEGRAFFSRASTHHFGCPLIAGLGITSCGG